MDVGLVFQVAVGTPPHGVFQCRLYVVVIAERVVDGAADDAVILQADAVVVEPDRIERRWSADFLIGERFSYCMGTSGPYAGVNSAARTHFTPEQRRSIFIDNLAAIPTFLWPKAPDNYADWIRIWEEVKAS